MGGQAMQPIQSSYLLRLGQLVLEQVLLLQRVLKKLK
jgi:hypothetical protein